MIFFFSFLVTWPYAWNNFFFLRKLSILISDLYLYGMKIQTNIKQNLVEKYARKSQIFEKNLKFVLDLAKPSSVILGWASVVRPRKWKANSGEWIHCSFCITVEVTWLEEEEEEEEKGRGPADWTMVCGGAVGCRWWRLGDDSRWKFFFFFSLLFLCISVFHFFPFCLCFLLLLTFFLCFSLFFLIKM